MIALSLVLALAPPTALSNQRFYDQREVDDVAAHGFDPFKWPTTNPPSLLFDRPGQVLIDYGNEEISCALLAGAKGTWIARCGAIAHSVTWEWTSPTQARTNLLGFDSPPIAVALLNQSPQQLRAAVDNALGRKLLRTLAGSWRDDAGTRIEIDARSHLWPCSVGCTDDARRTVCVERSGEPRYLLLLEGDAGTRLLEGTKEGVCSSGPALEPSLNGRSFSRTR